MSNGYRSLGIAALAAALLIAFGLGAYWMGLPYPQERYQPYQSSDKVEKGARATVSNVTASVVERTPCNNPQSEGESDLCAQWRAAKAAEKSANWTKWGVLASIAGISLLLWQIMLTREAVKDTGDATVAMKRQNEITERAQRPWITIELSVEKIDLRGRHKFWYELNFTNVGQSVAHKFHFHTEIGYFSFADPTVADNFIKSAKEDIVNSKVVIAPRDSYRIPSGEQFADHEAVMIHATNINLDGFIPIIMVAAFYKIHSTQEDWNCSIKCFRLEAKTGGPIARHVNKVLADEISIKPHTGHIAT